MMAIGRYADTGKLGLETCGVKVNKIGKIIVNEFEQSTTPHIYGLGDVIDRGIELTPVAIAAGKLLAERLYSNSTKKMDYINVATTVFTPLEYGAIGYSEESAIKQFGEDNLVIYKKNCNILEHALPHRLDQAFFKLVCLKETEQVVGFHYCGPNAGELTQGVSIAMKMKATKEDFDNTIGIHPTVAENYTKLEFGVTEDTGC
jgi:thioredoxin reductase (NADPH)